METKARIKEMMKLGAPVALLGLGVAVGSCSAEDGPDISTPDAACQSVADTLKLLSSDDPTERELGVAHAETIWVNGNEDEAVSRGLRRDCGVEVLGMLDVSGVPRSALDAIP